LALPLGRAECVKGRKGWAQAPSADSASSVAPSEWSLFVSQLLRGEGQYNERSVRDGKMLNVGRPANPVTKDKPFRPG